MARDPRDSPGGTNEIVPDGLPTRTPGPKLAAVMRGRVEIDASRGEGGGQILRSALTLSLLTGRPVQLAGIRARRPNPGLRAQHLRAVELAARVGRASVEGAALGSRSLGFEPRGLRAGRFQVEIGTAGSTCLVLQTVFLAASRASAPSSFRLAGGTHVPWSPCFHYLERHWLPHLRRAGLAGRLELEAAGFYPRGGGCLRAEIEPAAPLAPLDLTDRGALRRIRGISGSANLPEHVADRQRQRALTRLAGRTGAVELEIARLRSPGRGSFLLLVGEFERSQCCFFALGARGKPAERVADEAVDQLAEFLRTDGAIDEYLADQLLVPLAFANGISELRTSRVTSHLLTNTEVIHAFLGPAVEIEGPPGAPGLVRIHGAGLPEGPREATEA